MENRVNTAFLYDYLKEKGITQKELAEKMSHSKMAVSYWFRCDNFTLKKCMEIVSTLGCRLVIDCSYDIGSSHISTVISLQETVSGRAFDIIMRGFGLSRPEIKNIGVSTQLLNVWFARDNVSIGNINDIAKANGRIIKSSLENIH